jgi:hypothetical protein
MEVVIEHSPSSSRVDQMSSIYIHAKIYRYIYLFIKHTYKRKRNNINFNLDYSFRYLNDLHVHYAYVFSNQNFDKNLWNISYMYMVWLLNVYTYEILNYRFDEKPKRKFF